MAKEVIVGEVVGAIDDDGPEEGEIEDDTSEEDEAEKNLCSSNSTDVNTSVGMKYYQSSSTSKSETHIVKSKIYSEDKKHPWRNSKRRMYNFYVDHDKPSYNRLTKSDLNSEHREINFHELLKDYRTSKHDNEGNSHEKENRHYSKEVRTDTSRKRECGVSDSQEDKLKRGRKRKPHRSPSRDRNVSVSGDTDGVRKRKEERNVGPKKNRKTVTRSRNIRESAALFARIRASKAAEAAEQQQAQSGGGQREVESSTEASELCPSNVKDISVSESAEGKYDDSQECSTGLDPPKEPESSKSLCSAGSSQATEKNEGLESKDEEEDVNKLRMIALQSAFRAKFLERKRRGITVRKQTRRTPHQMVAKESNVDSSFNLDDTADLLEAAAEEAVTSSASREIQSTAIENWEAILSSSLSEVPLPPDDPPLPSPVEDLTPVDMELALTDEEENVSSCQDIGDGMQSENHELFHPRVRSNRPQLKARNIPVTIGGRIQSSKVRKRAANNSENKRSNLLEVKTFTSEDQVGEDPDSSFVSMADVNVGSMILLDEVGVCSSPEGGPRMEEEQTSDAKSDLVQLNSNQACFSGNNVDDEDEELLRAKLLVDISRRHRAESTASNLVTAEKVKGSEPGVVHPLDHDIVMVRAVTEGLEPLMRPNGKSVAAQAINLQSERAKVPLKRSVQRTRRGQLLTKVRNRQVSIPNTSQLSMSAYAKSYLSKSVSRGKYQRVNQNRIAAVKKRIDGNLHVTVMGSGDKVKPNAVPQQQDRIVICLAEDSDESDEERQNALSKRLPLGTDLPLSLEKPFDNLVAPSKLPPVCDTTDSSRQPNSESQFPVANVSIDFEKSVDRFLKEVRSVQESKLQDKLPSRRENVMQKQTTFTGSKVISKTNVMPLGARVNVRTNAASVAPKVNLKVNVAPSTLKVAGNAAKAKPSKQIVKAVSGVTPQAVRHLPLTQQEEYRRLKMQISVLEELHKKRKAAEISQMSSGGGRLTQGKLGVCAAPKLVGQPGPLQETNPGAKSSGMGVSKASLDSRKSTNPLSSGTSFIVPTSGDDDDEDVNLMRERLLRSRLHKKISAKAETLAKKSEVTPATKEAVPCGPCAGVDSLDVPSRLFGKGNDEPTVKLAPLGDRLQREVTPSSGGTSSVKIPETVSSDERRAAHPVESSSREIIDSSDLSGKEKDCAAAKGGRVPSVSKAGLGIGECSPAVERVPSQAPTCGAQVGAALTVSRPVGGDEVEKVGGPGDGAEGILGAKAGTTQASLVPPRSIPLVPVTGVAAASTQFMENNDTRASELAELEFQLLSERHAALQYLSELSNLLTKMESEGALLRQKEMAAQKLRVELNCAESSIAVQKDFLKQLALTISSTHERVTSTRQRCSMLCHACTRLGTQLKQEKRLNGGKGSGYQVPTGGAALVKSQLSSVLWQTKKLKKAGLPFLRGQNFVTSAKCPTAKRLARQGETMGAVPWSNISSHSLEALKISSVSMSSPQPKTSLLGSSVPLGSGSVTPPSIENPFLLNAVSKPKAPGNPRVNILPDISRRKQPPTKSVLASGKFVFTSSLGAGASTSVASVESTIARAPSLVEQIPVSKVLMSTVASVAMMPPSQSIESGTGGTANKSDPASSEVVPSCSGEQTTSSPSVAGKGIQLRDYHSPLEPISRRIYAEKLATPSGSSQQAEDSVMLDPNVILCPYDLMGECQDEECPYQHQGRRGVAKAAS